MTGNVCSTQALFRKSPVSSRVDVAHRYRSALLLVAFALPGFAQASDWHVTGNGTCDFESLRSVELLEAVGTSDPILVAQLPSAEGDFELTVTSYPADHAKDGPVEIASVSLSLRRVGLSADDRVSIDGEEIAVEPNARIDSGKWRASSEFALRRALRSGKRLEVEMLRDGKPQRRSVDLAPLQAAFAAVEKSHWRCR